MSLLKQEVKTTTEKAAELCCRNDSFCITTGLELSLRPVTSTVRTNPTCLSPSTLSPNLQSLGPDCDSGAQFALQDPEMASVKLEDCSQTLELNVNIKDEEEEEKIGESVSHGDHVETFSTSREQQQEDHRAKRSHHCLHYPGLGHNRL
ncbi:uncharacterized protein LOC115127674 isoform X6 [Oncorhynchus nerka]|uniref:uncharacterized protein LOC115127674 isoform X6 n=1 Tax=Oncorhynchus nerka TaxID=8023 RepID=UPI0031B858C4